ncbi:MAG: VWA domain-containing protein [Flavobacteriia bacterium]
MKNKKTIYHFIVDQSGSMSGSEAQTIEGFNAQLLTLQRLRNEFPENEYVVSVTYFEDEVMDIIKFQSVENIALLNRDNYKPGGLTALLDGMGKSITAVKDKYGREIENDQASVVIVVLTDGGENASKFYTRPLIAEMIKELDATGKWTFSFLGADFDAVRASQDLNIRRENIMSFSKANYSAMMADMSNSIVEYERQKSSGNMKQDLFDLFQDKDRRDDSSAF